MFSCQENQSITYVHSCLWVVVILIKNDYQQSQWKVRGSCISCQTKHVLLFMQPRLGLTEYSRTTDSLRMVGQYLLPLPPL